MQKKMKRKNNNNNNNKSHRERERETGREKATFDDLFFFCVCVQETIHCVCNSSRSDRQKMQSVSGGNGQQEQQQQKRAFRFSSISINIVPLIGYLRNTTVSRECWTRAECPCCIYTCAFILCMCLLDEFFFFLCSVSTRIPPHLFFFPLRLSFHGLNWLLDVPLLHFLQYSILTITKPPPPQKKKKLTAS